MIYVIDSQKISLVNKRRLSFTFVKIHTYSVYLLKFILLCGVVYSVLVQITFFFFYDSIMIELYVSCYN